MNPNVILNQLYKHTQLQDTFGVIMLALVDNQPKVMNLLEMLQYYLRHQEDVVTRRTQYDLNKAQERAHILEGLLIALDNIDEVIRIIRGSKNVQEAKAELIKRFGLSDVQAQALPEDKLNCVLKEIGSGFRPMVVGDGINDSLALKAGVVGVAMGAGGADIALASADVVLIGSDLRRLGTCVRLSRQCRQTLQVNVIIGLGWTLAIVAFAAFGWLGAAGAMIAAVLHNLSTLLVLGNAGRLLRFQVPLLKL